MFHLTQTKRGVSALELSRRLDINYNTAWKIHHKLRQVMLEREFVSPLERCIEMDDASHGSARGGRRPALLSWKEARNAANQADFRWRAPGEADRAGLLRTVGRPCALDHASSGCALRRAQDRCRPRTTTHSAGRSKQQTHLSDCWVIPPKAIAAFVAAMEDVLHV